MVAIADSVPKPISRFRFILDRRDILGAIFVGLLVNVASLAGLDYSLQRVVEGVLVLVVVILTGVLSLESRQRR